MTRVLLVEDDPAVRRGVVLGLSRNGHETEAVGTGEDGLEALAAFKPNGTHRPVGETTDRSLQQVSTSLARNHQEF